MASNYTDLICNIIYSRKLEINVNLRKFQLNPSVDYNNNNESNNSNNLARYAISQPSAKTCVFVYTYTVLHLAEYQTIVNLVTVRLTLSRGV